MLGAILNAVFLGLGLSMDAAAVSMTNGMSEPDIRLGKTLLIAAFYGVFQGVMPLIGYLAGSIFTDTLSAITPYLALAILTVLGVKTLIEGIRRKEQEQASRKLGLGTLAVQAAATSIDALAVGVVLVSLATAQALVSMAVIAAVTFIISCVSVYIGKKIGGRLQNKAYIIGGVVRILIGLKIFLEGIL